MNLIITIKLALDEKYGDKLIILAREGVEDDDNDFLFRVRDLSGIARVYIKVYINSKVKITVRFSTNLKNFGKFEESFKQIIGRIVDDIEVVVDSSSFLSVSFIYPYLSQEAINTFVEFLDEIFAELNAIGLIFERLDALNL